MRRGKTGDLSFASASSSAACEVDPLRPPDWTTKLDNRV